MQLPSAALFTLPCLAWVSQLLSLFGMRAARFTHPADRAGNKILIYLPIPGNGKHRHALVLQNIYEHILSSMQSLRADAWMLIKFGVLTSERSQTIF